MSLINRWKILTLTFLVISGVAVGWIIFGTSKNSASNPYPLIDISRNFIPQNDFIVNIQPLREQLQKIVEDNGKDNISIYFEFLNTGANIQINNELRFYPASLIKIPSVLVTMKKIENGDWNLNNELILFETDKDSRYGELYKYPVGSIFTIEKLLKILLIDSDNTAHKILKRNLTDEEFEKLQKGIGLDELFDENYKISAKEYSRLFRSLYTSSFLKREYSQQILSWLTETPFNNFLASGLPKDIIFSHKIGEDNKGNNYLDSGIVYLFNRPYLLTTMIKECNKEKAEEIMKNVSRAAYDYIKNYE
ncbi:MAG: class A beta-lactamase-related serine hydrolase [Candidatus Pacebacteria bacterium]|nr:class A beta-lactamase-related serine hydrolase [Candidatus Paceibacterota bacterium]